MASVASTPHQPTTGNDATTRIEDSVDVQKSPGTHSESETYTAAGGRMPYSCKRPRPTAVVSHTTLRSTLSLLVASAILVDLHGFLPPKQSTQDAGDAGALGWLSSLMARAAPTPEPFVDDGMFDPRRDYWGNRSAPSTSLVSSRWAPGKCVVREPGV